MLFRNRRPDPQQPSGDPLQRHAQTVEAILQQIDVKLEDARLKMDQGYGWHFRRGSAVIEIYITEQNGRGNLQVLSPIMHLPTAGLLPLYRRMLELNLQLTNAALGVYYDVVYVFNERPLEGLDPSETNYIISMVAAYADQLDNQLVNEFGGRLFSQPGS